MLRQKKLYELHPNCTPKVEENYYNLEDEYFEVLRKCEGYPLGEHLSNVFSEDPIPIHVLAKWLLQCATTLEQIELVCNQKAFEMKHHGRICPNNIVCGTEIKFVKFAGSLNRLTVKQIEKSDDVQSFVFCQAPEVLQSCIEGKNLNELDMAKCDIFSLGTTFVLLFAKGRGVLLTPAFYRAWKNRNARDAHVNAIYILGRLFSFYEGYEKLADSGMNFMKILTSMVRYDPQDRLDYKQMQELLINYNCLLKKTTTTTLLTSTTTKPGN